MISSLSFRNRWLLVLMSPWQTPWHHQECPLHGGIYTRIIPADKMWPQPQGISASPLGSLNNCSWTKPSWAFFLAALLFHASVCGFLKSSEMTGSIFLRNLCAVVSPPGKSLLQNPQPQGWGLSPGGKFKFSSLLFLTFPAGSSWDMPALVVVLLLRLPGERLF